MQLVKSLNELTKLNKGGTIGLTIGNFDGVHGGHQDFLSSIRKDCHDNGLAFVVVTFIPHPRQILDPTSNFLINSYKERRDLLENIGVDYLYEIDFTRDFSTLGPEVFLNDFIFNQGVDIKKLYLGHDFAFGANKSGDFEFVKKYCSLRDVEFFIEQGFKSGDATISSSRIRTTLAEGKITDVNKLLRREYYILGTVIKGHGRGREIGYPTANLSYDQERVIPNKGVYITKTMYRNKIYHSVTNIGVNPTFGTDGKLNVETHILDFEKDIYGEEISVFFVKKLRDEQKFSSVEDLIKQIGKDVQAANAHFLND